MGKVGAGLTLFPILAALALGLALSGALVQSAPEVRAAIAQQERAEAGRLEARADTERAHAAQAWAWVDATRALAGAVSRWSGWIVGAVVLALAVLGVGLAWAVAGWANSRARLRVIRTESGPVLAYLHSGRVLVLDTARALGSVHLLDEVSGRVTAPNVDSDAQAHIASQALAAGVIVRAAGGADRSDVAERVGVGLHAVMGSLSLPGLRDEPASVVASTAAPGPALRFMRVRSAEVRNREAAELDAHDLRHFITEGASGRGYGRSAWVGQTLATGRRCTRTRWGWLMGALDEAGLLTDGPNNARVLAVSVAEACERLSLGAGDTDDAEADE